MTPLRETHRCETETEAQFSDEMRRFYSKTWTLYGWEFRTRQIDANTFEHEAFASFVYPGKVPLTPFPDDPFPAWFLESLRSSLRNALAEYERQGFIVRLTPEGTTEDPPA